MRINARVVDATGKDVPNAKFVYVTVPDETEHTGPWVAGWAGTQMVMVVALVPGQAPLDPVQTALRILPAPASRVELNGVPGRMVVGQGATLTTAVYTATGDRREDEPRFSTSAATIATVDGNGRVAAVGPGTATITATAGTARTTRTLVVVPNTIRAVVITGGAAPVGKANEAVTLKPVEKGIVMPFGRDVFQQACTYMTKVTQTLLDKHHLAVADLTYLIPHQANLRISKNVTKQLGIDPARAVSNIERLGNTGCAGAAIGLAEVWNTLVSGNKVIITVFGGGYSYGAMLLEKS